MENKVLISEHQQATTQDANNFGQFPRDSMDHLVDDIGPGFKYTGFATAITATTKIVVGPGRLFDIDGKVYFNADQGGTEIDFIGVLPTVGKRYVGIVASGAEILTQTEPRTFVIDAQTRATEARVTPTISSRHANIQTVNGVVGPDPQQPLIPSNYLVFAWVLLNTTGVESVTMVETNRASSIESLEADVANLNVWRIQFGQQLDNLATLLANLAARIGGLAAMDFVMRLVVDVTRLKEKAGLPDTYTAWGSDYFLDEEESDTDNVAYLARIEEGLRFAHAAERVAVLALQNPIDSSVNVQGDLMLPAFGEVRRLSNVAAPVQVAVRIPYVYNSVIGIPYGSRGLAYLSYYTTVAYRTIFQSSAPGEVSISQFANQSFAYVRHYPVRWRVRWGVPYFYSSRINYWWDQRHDPVWWTFRRISSDSAFVVLAGPPFYQPVPLPGIFSWKYQWVRSRWFWWDYVSDYPYWERVETSHSVNGSVMSQTFLNNQDGWITGAHFFFTKKGAAGDVTVLLCETYETGQPNPNAVIAVANAITPGEINIWPNATRAFFPPTLLMQGKRYAYVFVTSGAHFVATTEQNQLTHGTLFYSTDSAWFQGFGDMSRDVAFENLYAQFNSTRTEVQLAPAELSGGIAAIDINTNAQVPGGTTLTFEAQVDGEWVPINDPGLDADAPLIGLPPLLNIRAVFEGTNSLQPGISIGNSSQIYTWRGRADFTHFSEVRTMPSPIDTCFVTLRLENWLDTPHHVCTTTLFLGKKVTGATVQASGSGGDYNVGDTITLANGVVLTVATAGATTVTTVTITNAGHLAIAASTPSNPVSQVSSSGTGTGATFNLTWGDDLQTADATVDTVTPEDDLAIERKLTFSGMPLTSTYQIKIVGTTDNVLTPYHVAERVDIALDTP